MENRRIQAFSRVEMVVVGVCAALVLFVTLPSLTGAREAGKRAICLANLKTLGAGMLQYAQDYEGKIPVWGCQFDELGRFGTGYWNNPDNDQLTKFVEWGYIWEYVQNRKPFVCPALNNKMNPKARIASGLHTALVWGWPDGAGTANPPGPMWSYCVNAQAGMSMEGSQSQWRVNPELVMPSPKTVFMLYEGDFNDYASYDNTVVLFNPIYDRSSNAEDSLGRYHLVLGEREQSASSTFNNKKGSGNLVFFDGHVGTMTLDEFIIQRSTPAGTLELCGGYQGFSGW